MDIKSEVIEIIDELFMEDVSEVCWFFCSFSFILLRCIII